MTKTADDYKKDYTDPILREKLKEQIKKDSKGGKAGEWSARKSQLLKKTYEDQGGGYKHSGSLTAAQKDLKKWTKEEWQTVDGSKAIKEDGHETDRYLPHETWEKLSIQEKKSTREVKKQASKDGQQYVKNPSKVAKKNSNVKEKS